MGTARFIKRLPVDGEPRVDAALYRVDPPMSLEVYVWEGEELADTSKLTTLTSDYVRVSASTLPGRPETYIFLADDQGDPINWRECEGSIVGELDHAVALKEAGYAVVDTPTIPRVPVEGRTVRYDAGIDICLLTLQILKEFVEDDRSGPFMCVHDDILPTLDALIERGDRINSADFDGDELEAWSFWLRDVSFLIPRLWD